MGQTNTISPKTFITALEDISKALKWEVKSFNIIGEKFSNICFTDDIVLFVETMDDLKNMLEVPQKTTPANEQSNNKCNVKFQ